MITISVASPLLPLEALTRIVVVLILDGMLFKLGFFLLFLVWAHNFLLILPQEAALEIFRQLFLLFGI